MSVEDALRDANDARDRWRAIDGELNRLRSVHAALTDLQEVVSRGTASEEATDAVWSALAALGGDDTDRRKSLRFLADPVFGGQRTFIDEFQRARAVDPSTVEVGRSLVAFIEGTAELDDVADAVEAIIGDEPIAGRALDDLTALFAVAVEAGIAAGEQESDRLAVALREAYDTVETPLPALDEQPIALLPVRLETRFVDESGRRGFVEDAEIDPAHLLIRVYPDQFHIDSHESELTDDEVEWGTHFWTVLWVARHPAPDAIPRDSDSDYLTKRLPERRLREVASDLVADVQGETFSDDHYARYQELKERAWKKLVDRFGRERAAYVVHRLEPTDEQLAIDLLTPPPGAQDVDNATEGARVVQKSGGYVVARETDRDGRDTDTSQESASSNEWQSGVRSAGVDDVAFPSSCWLDPRDLDEDEGKLVELPEQLPPIAFPSVPRRPTSWTKSARAKLLPDRWIAVAEWTDPAGNSNRTSVAGEPIRDPLQVGPGLESVAEELLTESSDGDSPAPEGTEWLVDFTAAEDVGMALRIPLGALGGFDHRRGFDRISVFGVKGSMPAADTPAALADLLDAHHYTDGLAVVEQGTPTNNHERPSGYERRPDPRESMETECVPPKVVPGDRSDGDILARALAIDRGGGTDHVFANVANADGTEQRDARHMNSALWPATLGYYFQHILVDNQFAGNPSIWDNGEGGTDPSVADHLLELDAYRRHFIRYVRGRGPFPALRIGRHPYGVLPATAIETARDLSVLEPSLLSQLSTRQASIEELRDRGYELSDLAGGGVDPELLVAAGAPGDAVVEAGAEPSHLVRGTASPTVDVRQEQVVPSGLIKDGVGLTTSEDLTTARLEAVGIDVEALQAADISVGDLARGTVTEQQLEASGVTIEQLGDVLVCEEAKQLGITPDALCRADVSPMALLRSAFTEDHITALGLDTRAVGEAILPEDLKQAGITVKRLQEAGIAPWELLTGEVADEPLRVGGIEAEAVVHALFPTELLEIGVTPDRVLAAGITCADLFNGSVTDGQLQEAGISTAVIADAMLPSIFRDIGVTPTTLEEAGITPAAVVNGNVTPADLAEAGIDPESLAAADVLQEVLGILGDGLGELIDTGINLDDLLSETVSPATLLDAGVDPELLLDAGLAPDALVRAAADITPPHQQTRSIETLLAAGIEPEALEVAGYDADRLIEAGVEIAGLDGTMDTRPESEGTDPGSPAIGTDGGSTAPVSEDLPYAVAVRETPIQAERDLYRFSFDPATPTIQPTPCTHDDLTGGLGGAQTEITEGDGEFGNDKERADPDSFTWEIPVARPIQIDHMIRSRLGRRVSGFGRHWARAISDLPFGSVVTELDLIDALKRTAVSGDIRHRTMVYSGEATGVSDRIIGEVSDLFLEGHQATVRDALELADAADLDPRVASLYPFDSSEFEHPESGSDLITLQFPRFHRMVGAPQQGIVAPYDDVDADIGRFMDIIRARQWREIDYLGDPLDFGEPRIAPPMVPQYPFVRVNLDAIPETEEEWWSVEMSRRQRFVEEIESSDDPLTHVERLVTEARGTNKPEVMAKNQSDFGDSGVLRSLLRVLLQFGTLQTYITARRRLGAAYADPPDGWPERSLWTGQRGPLDSLDDQIPPQLCHHPAIDDPTMSYGDALHLAASDHPVTTSIDARVSEYMDSVAYLRQLKPIDLAALMHETLDLANHRLDAWWTSIATKELFELRELQGSSNGHGDRNIWAGAGGAVPFSTADPGLTGYVGAVPRDVDRVDETDATTAGTATADWTDHLNIAAYKRYDAATHQPISLLAESAEHETGRSIDELGGPTLGGLGDIEDIGSFDGAATRETPNPDSLPERASTEPGLYVGGYGFVENLQPDLDSETGPEFIHAPSEQHATTAALLRSGWDAHEADEGGNIMDMTLSPERVRAARWLIRGVRRGQSLGELLGFRFERRLHEETLADASERDRDEVNLMQYVPAFRARFPAIVDKIERPDEPRTATREERKEELATHNTVDGYRLVQEWDEYPFGREDELPDQDGAESTAYEVLETIVAELKTAISAVGNVLTAESVHQLGMGNFEQAGGSIDALAKGEPFPDPAVIDTPQAETGFSHRQCVLLSARDTPPTDTPRSRAAPAVAAWIEEMLPDLETVECQATYLWTDADGEEQAVSTTVSLSEVALGPLDILYLFGSDAEEPRSELASRLVYQLLRDPPQDGVPPDATVELALGATAGEEATSVAHLLEFARSVRTLVQETRPVRADDLTHPSEPSGPGYDENTYDALYQRAQDAWVDLHTWAEVIDDRLALLDVDHTLGDAIDDLTDPTGRAEGSDSDEPTTGSRGTLGGNSLLPGSRSATPRADSIDSTATVTEQVERVAEAAETAEADVPMEMVASIVSAIETDALRAELDHLLESLPAGPTTRSAIRATHTVPSAADATLSGTVKQGRPDPEVTDTNVEPTDSMIVGSTTLFDASSDTSISEMGPIENDTVHGGGFLGEDPRSEIDGDRVDADDPTSIERGEPGRDPVTVRVWGTDGISWFERETSAAVARDGTFTATVDLSSVAPGTPFIFAAVQEDDVRYAAEGRVVGAPAGDEVSPLEVLRSRCPNVRRLLWLMDAYDALRVDRGPAGELANAIEAADWDRIMEEREGMDVGAVLTDADLEAIDALLTLATVDPDRVATATLRLGDPVSRTGLHQLFMVAGNDPDVDGAIRFRERPALTEVRARLYRVLEETGMYNEGVPPRLLAYDPGTAVHLMNGTDGPTIAAYLDAFLAGSAWVARYVTHPRLDVVSLLSGLTAWLHDPEALAEPAVLASQLRTLSADIADYPSLETLFEGLPHPDDESTAMAFGEHLQTVARLIEDGTGDVRPTDDAVATFVEDRSAAADELSSELEGMQMAIDSILATESVPESFREGILESLRTPLAVLANYGVMGATPRIPAGGTAAAEEQLVEQSRAVLRRVRRRLLEMDHPDDTDPLEARVDEQRERLEVLFGNGFTVLPPFRPTNSAELHATFTSDDLIPEDSDLAAESWLQRAAAVRDRIDDFREVRTYGEVLSGAPGDPLTIGQVPYEPGDTWVGVDGVDPTPGRLSIVAQFGSELGPSDADGRMVGLFVDEWHESIPAAETTTGVALHYDDPGNRAPNAVLLVPPPPDGALSGNDLAAVIAETSAWTRRRAVDYGDMDGIDHLLPAMYLPTVGARRRQPIVDLRMLDWYDWTAVEDLLDPAFFREQVLTSVASDRPSGGETG